MNFTPSAGDIILVRGTRWRSRVSRVLSFLKWNHATLYYRDNRVQELRWGGTKRFSFQTYKKKRIVVLRLCPIDSLIQGSRQIAFVQALDELKNLEFDWKAFFIRIVLHLSTPDKEGQATCDEYIELVYKRAHRGFAPHDAKPNVNIYDIMRHDYSDQQLLQKYRLIKVYDYRDK